LRFLVDAQLPAALARRIEAFGHVAEHVSDCGLASAPDRDIRTYAVNVGAVIITKDEDFVVRKMLESGPAVVWVRIGNTRRADLLRRLETHFASILNALERGETLVEVV
jgi:predicted nuclease of predicted toxin-antitoxin system